VSAALLVLASGEARAQQAQTSQLMFALPAMPLGEALRAVARQGGRSVVVDDRLVAGRMAPPLSGQLTPEQAIDRLLAGTGLASRNVEGTLVISGPPSATASGSAQATAQTDETIVVTGTHVRGALPTSPVLSITRSDIERQAPASVEELFRKLPQNVASGVGQENFGTTGTGADITDHGAGLNLRGLGQRATLTLVNGRRIAPAGTGSFVDVSLIPISAVDRVEIVTDGASAIYGSDAVGGVVNLILKQDFSGLETIAQGGTTTRGGGEQLLLGGTAGDHWNSGHALLAYEFRADQPIRAGDRRFTINLPDDWMLLPGERRHSIYGTIEQQLAPKLTFELSGLFASRETQRSFFIAGPVVPVDARAHARTYGGTAALRWAPVGDWQIEGSAGWYRDKTSEEENQPAGQGLVNRFNTDNSIADFTFKANGSLIHLPGGAAKLALGGEYRHEHFSSFFETLVNLPNPQEGSRNVSSLYGEIYGPLVGSGNRLPGVERLAISAAGRLDHYQGIGTSTDPKLGILWSPAAGLNLRSSWSTSFRAPLLSETLGYYNAFLFPAALLFVDPSQGIPGVGGVLIGSNPKVKPERSRSLTIGADWAPPKLPGLKLNATYYAIRFSNRIGFPSDQIVVVGDPALAPIVTLNPDVSEVTSLLNEAGQVLDFSGPGFTNGNATPADVVLLVDVRSSNTAETRTSGLDLTAAYDWNIGAHAFHADLNVNRVFHFTDRLTATSPAIDTLNTPFHPVGFRARAGLAWTYAHVSADVALNYTEHYHDNRANRDERVASFTTVDAGLAYDFGKTGSITDRLRLALAIQNLFDQRPPRLANEPGFTRGIGYDPVNANGRGRVVSVQLRKAWR
jgi:outer membrane receptor protein involved in Fe transport